MDLWHRLTDDARQALLTARNLARGHGCTQITPEHIALGILTQEQSLACQVLHQMGVDMPQLRQALARAAAHHATGGQMPQELQFTPTAARCLRMAHVEARKHAAPRATSEGDRLLTTAHLLLGLTSPVSTTDLNVLRIYGVFYGEVGEILQRMNKSDV